MNTNWKELKDTLLDLYRRCYEHDKKYREYLESTHNLQDLEDYRNSFSDHKPTPYFVLQYIKDLSDDGRGEKDKYILYYLLHINSMLDRIPIVHKMLSIIDDNYEKKDNGTFRPKPLKRAKVKEALLSCRNNIGNNIEKSKLLTIVNNC